MRPRVVLALGAWWWLSVAAALFAFGKPIDVAITCSVVCIAAREVERSARERDP